MATNYHVVCDGCGCCTYFTEEEFGTTVDCDQCELSVTLPESADDLVERNRRNLAESTRLPDPKFYRIMLQGEDGTLSCLKNAVPVEYAQLVADGYQSHYTEGQQVFLEPEETIADLYRQYGGSDYED